MFSGRRLYAIVDVDASLAAGRVPLEVAHAYLAAGVRVLQIRAKHLAAAELLTLMDAVQNRVADSGALVITNDRVDVARASGTGVHVGQGDLPVEAARRQLGRAAIVGVSTHTLTQLTAALRAPADYVAFGPVFATTTKADPDAVVGLDGVAAACRMARAAGRPLVAIGGITLARAPEVLAAGADALAVIGDLLAGPEEPEARTRRFLAVVR